LVLKRRDRFDYDGSDVFLQVPSGLDDFADLLKASVLLSTILEFVLNQRVFHRGEWCAGPIEGWNTLKVHAIITARKGADRVSVIAMLESEHAKVGSILDAMVLSIVEEGNC
jgi:hypothetical protein